jgi:hypothetical protein
MRNCFKEYLDRSLKVLRPKETSDFMYFEVGDNEENKKIYSGLLNSGHGRRF